jgi:hypothetical protein
VARPLREARGGLRANLAKQVYKVGSVEKYCFQAIIV